jgi:hypothetical protein
MYDTVKNNRANPEGYISLEFAYNFNYERVRLALNNKVVLNEVLISDPSTDFAKEQKAKGKVGSDTITLSIEIGKSKPRKLILKRTNYYYFFFDREEKFLKIRALNEPLITG